MAKEWCGQEDWSGIGAGTAAASGAEQKSGTGSKRGAERNWSGTISSCSSGGALEWDGQSHNRYRNGPGRAVERDLQQPQERSGRVGRQ